MWQGTPENQTWDVTPARFPRLDINGMEQAMDRSLASEGRTGRIHNVDVQEGAVVGSAHDPQASQSTYLPADRISKLLQYKTGAMYGCGWRLHFAFGSELLLRML